MSGIVATSRAEVAAEIEAAFQDFRQAPYEQTSKLPKAMQILKKLITNIIENPSLDKYRCINEENSTLCAHFFSVDGCLALLHLIGFERDGSRLVLEDYGRASKDGALQLAILSDALNMLQRFVDENLVKDFAETGPSSGDGMCCGRPGKDRCLRNLEEELPLNEISENEIVKKAKTSPHALDDAQEQKVTSLVITLQSLSDTRDVILADDATVVDLRASAAKWKCCEQHQVRLVLASSESSRRLDCDCMKLSDYGIHGNCVVVVSISEADECALARMKLESNRKYLPRLPSNLPLIGVHEFAHTRKYLDIAQQSGMEVAKFIRLKRSLNMKDMSPKEVRVAIREDLEERGVCANELDNTDESFCSAVAQACARIEKMKYYEAHGIETSLNNREGLLVANRQKQNRAEI